MLPFGRRTRLRSPARADRLAHLAVPFRHPQVSWFINLDFPPGRTFSRGPTNMTCDRSLGPRPWYDPHLDPANL